MLFRPTSVSGDVTEWPSVPLPCRPLSLGYLGMPIFLCFNRGLVNFLVLYVALMRVGLCHHLPGGSCTALLFVDLPPSVLVCLWAASMEAVAKGYRSLDHL